jgi:hypothetical protein
VLHRDRVGIVSNVVEKRSRRMTAASYSHQPQINPAMIAGKVSTNSINWFRGDMPPLATSRRPRNLAALACLDGLFTCLVAATTLGFATVELVQRLRTIISSLVVDCSMLRSWLSHVHG